LGGALSGVRRYAMPQYEFLCDQCQKPFEVTMIIAEHEKGKVRCPTCKGRGPIGVEK
jgi:putative FmdB family regulatory protein